MRAVAFTAFCAFLFALVMPAAPARAGGYGIGVHGPGYVWYSSSCCYRRVVRHQREVFYVRAGSYLPDNVIVYARPRVHTYVEPHLRVRSSEFDIYLNDGGFGVAGCYWHEAPVPVRRGGWVWGRKTTCY